MKPSLVDYLSCLSCRQPLTLQVSQSCEVEGGSEAEVISGTLLCRNCADEYPITAGVPRFVKGNLSHPRDLHTGMRFGEAWKEFPRLHERYRKQFYDWLYPVDENFVQGKVVLEAGCGKGRHAKIVAESGAKMVIGIDIGDAVDVAYQQIGHLPRVHLIQCDIRNLPFAEVFDFCFSVGVLHHMSHPEEGFQSIVKTLKPDGSVCIWVYGRENNGWLIHLINPLRLGVTSKLPPGPLRALAFLTAVPVYCASKAFFKPYVKIKSRLAWLPNIFYEKYMNYISAFDFDEIHHIVFDHLTAPVAYYVPGQDVQNWFERAGLDDHVVRWHNENSWTGFASKHDVVSREMIDRVTSKNSIRRAFLPRKDTVGTGT